MNSDGRVLFAAADLCPEGAEGAVVRRVEFVEFGYLAAEVVVALDEVDPVPAAGQVKGRRHPGHAATDNQNRSYFLFCRFHFQKT
jgi:hypothetical protein